MVFAVFLTLAATAEGAGNCDQESNFFSKVVISCWVDLSSLINSS
jgi:hypothetical protein